MDNVVNLRGLHNFGQKVTFRRRLTGMSQKKRKPVPTPQAKTKPAGKKTSPEDPDLSFTLIRFDQKVWAVLGICIFLFFLFVLIKWHNSSIGYWNVIADDGGAHDRGILMGKPRPIRSDEWQVNTPFTLSQVKKDFPLENKALGAEKTPLTFGLPTHHIVSLVKPAFWGYFLLDAERGFSWQWNFKLFPFLIASFLLLMLLTRNHFAVSLAGSMWLLLSSATQWWSIYTELFTYGILSVLGILYMIFGEKKYQILIAAVVFVLSAHSYIMVMYPAYQVPYAYALMALTGGYCWMYRKDLAHQFRQGMSWRILALTVSFALVLILLFLFYVEARDTIRAMTQTVYPGQRNETGGDFHFTRLFADNFTWFMDDMKFPAKWGNISELSGYLMLSFLPMVLLLVESWRRKKRDVLLIALSIYQVLILLYMLMGFPNFLSKLTLLNASPATRSYFVLGFVNIVFTLLALTRYKITLIPNTWLARGISFAGLFGISLLINSMVNAKVDTFFTSGQVWVATLLFSSFNWLVLQYHHGKSFKIAFWVLLGVFLFPNIRINPLAQGLTPFNDNKIYRAIVSIESQDPGAGWVVFGRSNTPNFLKAAGVNCFNGVQFAPPLDELRVLDPEMKNDSIYNRFAHIGFTSLIQPNDSIEFALKQADKYMIRMDPCSPRLTQLGIKYVLFTQEPNAFELTCMTHVATFPGHYIYKRNMQ